MERGAANLRGELMMMGRAGAVMVRRGEAMIREAMIWLGSGLWPREIERRERAEVSRWLDSDIWGRESMKGEKE